MACTAEKIEYTTLLDEALAGKVTVDIGQVGPNLRRVLDQAVRAGKLVKWRGRWYPYAGSAYGMGPLKTCWSTPETRAALLSLDAAQERAARSAA
jgi:hypothetical protein